MKKNLLIVLIFAAAIPSGYLLGRLAAKGMLEHRIAIEARHAPSIKSAFADTKTHL